MLKRATQLLLTTTALVVLLAAPVLANPLGPQIAVGVAQIDGLGTDALSVQQSSNKAIVNWNTFDIGLGETTTIIQPGVDSVLLNRVTGGLGGSQILGALSANGQVFLINPDGVLFGKNATVDVGALVVTTHDLVDGDFLSGNYAFGLSGNPGASIVNLGTISVTDGGFAALVAPGVRNDGVIRANLGQVALASGNSFSLDLYGDGLIKLAVDDEIAGQVIDLETGLPLTSLVANNGLLRADGGTVQLTAAAAREVLDSVINNSGVIEADTIGTRKGKIVLSAQTAKTKAAGAATQKVKVSGQLSAVGAEGGETGGDIEITGEEIELTVATIDAFGWSGGGTVHIGGDVGGGGDSAFNATSTTTDVATAINVSATGTGDGGAVVLWSDDATQFRGRILARGGEAGGDGGFVEVSGRNKLGFSGVVDVGAPAGDAGTLLLDPQDITIGGTGPWVVDPAALRAALASDGIVIVYTKSGYAGGGDITIDADLVVDTSRLFLLANRNIIFADGASIKNYGATSAECCGHNLVLASGSTWNPSTKEILYAGSGTIVFQGSSFVDFTGGGFEDEGDVLVVYDPNHALTNESVLFASILSNGDLTRWTWISPGLAMDIGTGDTFVPGDLSSWDITEMPAQPGSTKVVQPPARIVKAEPSPANTNVPGTISSSVVRAAIPSLPNRSVGLGWSAEKLAAGIAGHAAAVAAGKEDAPYGLGYCTDYVRLVYGKYGTQDLSFRGNAADWYSEANRLGLRTLPAGDIASVPPGAIAVWDNGGAGHVAIVVDNTGSGLTLSEANWGQLPDKASAYEKDHIVTKEFGKHQERTIQYTGLANRSGYTLLGFILP